MRCVTALLVLGLLGACSSGDGSEAGGVEGAATERIEKLAEGQFGQVWEMIHPAQQKLIDRETYVRCATASLSGADFEVEEVTDSYEQEMVIPGTDTTVTVTNVTLRVSDGETADTQTQPFVDVDGEWRSILPDPAVFEDC